MKTPAATLFVCIKTESKIKAINDKTKNRNPRSWYRSPKNTKAPQFGAKRKAREHDLVAIGETVGAQPQVFQLPRGIQ